MARVQIGHDDDGQLVINVARNVHGEALPSAAMFEQPVPIYFRDAPSESVGRGLAAVQLYRRPHLVEAGFFQEPFGIQGSVPFRQVEDIGIQGAVGGGLHWADAPYSRSASWRNALLETERASDGDALEEISS